MEETLDSFEIEDIEKMDLLTARDWVSALLIRSKRQKAEIKRLKDYIVLLEESCLRNSKKVEL